MPPAPPRRATDSESRFPWGRSTRQSRATKERDAWSDERSPDKQQGATWLMLIARPARHPCFSSLSAATRGRAIMFAETGEVSADDRARVSNPKSEAVLRARRDLGAPPSARRSDRPSLQASPPRDERATSGARRGERPGQSQGKDLERRRSAELAAAGHSTRPTDLQLFSAKAVMRNCLVDRRE
jgi:hypothetical protein